MPVPYAQHVGDRNPVELLTTTLEEYRDAAEFVRTCAGAVKHIRECQLQERPDTEAISSLCVDRIQRSTALCIEVMTDVEAGKRKVGFVFQSFQLLPALLPGLGVEDADRVEFV
jgi:recombinational DNA repair protein RecR